MRRSDGALAEDLAASPEEAAGAKRFLAREFSYAAATPGPARARWVAVEAAVALEFGGQPHAVMMASPADLTDFAYGFAFTEGVIEKAGDVRAVEIVESAAGVTLKVALTGSSLSAHMARERALIGRTSCGLCGVEDFAALPRPTEVASAAPIAPEAVKIALTEFDRQQRLNALTHSAHGAAWCRRDGTILTLREDVGRHNALDKLIGALLLERVNPADGFILISSRCSMEMVAKAARFGVATLVSLSAPTSVALEMAGALGMTVIAVARADHALVFAPAALGA